MSKKINGGVVIYLSLIVMFVGLAILYFLNSSGTTIFQNFKTKSVRTQLINNISSGLAIATDAQLPEFNENNKIVIQTIEHGTIEIMQRPQYAISLWGQNEYVGIARSELMKTSSDFTISLWFYPQTGGSNYPLKGEGLFTFGYLTEEESDFGYNGSFVRNGDGSEVRLVFRMALSDYENNQGNGSWHHQFYCFQLPCGKMTTRSPRVLGIYFLIDHSISNHSYRAGAHHCYTDHYKYIDFWKSVTSQHHTHVCKRQRKYALFELYRVEKEFYFREDQWEPRLMEIRIHAICHLPFLLW